jgi:hypothetical protein
MAAYAFPLFMRGASLFAGDGDPGRHIRVGSYILETRSIPRVDLFSHTMQGEPFIPFEWLSEAIFAGFHMSAGLAGAAVLTALLFGGTVALVYLTMVRSGVPTFVAFLFAFVSMTLQAMHLHPRPHMFTTLLVAVFAFILLEARRDRRTGRLLLLPPLMAVWANLHGGFLVGFILLFMFAADSWLTWRGTRGESSPRYAMWITGVLGLCFLASLLSPARLELWPHTTGYLKEDWLVDFTQEYMSPNFHDPLIKLRNIPLFAVLALPWLATWTIALADQDTRPGRALDRFMEWTRRLSRTEATLTGWPIVAVGVVVLTAAALRPDRREVYSFSSEVFPVAAVESLLESDVELVGPVYNEFGWGGYLLYRAWPEIPVFIDGQTDFYGEELTQEYVRIRGLRPDWETLLDKHGVRWALIPVDAPLAQGLELHADWERVYSDSVAVAFVLEAASPASSK